MSVGFLAHYSNPDRPNAIARAKFLVEQVLCESRGGIPANALEREFTPDSDKTSRQNFEAFTSSPACAGCHRTVLPTSSTTTRFDLFPQLDLKRPSVDLGVTGEGIRNLFDNSTGTQSLERARAANYAMAAEFAAGKAADRLDQVTSCADLADDRGQHRPCAISEASCAGDG